MRTLLGITIAVLLGAAFAATAVFTWHWVETALGSAAPLATLTPLAYFIIGSHALWLTWALVPAPSTTRHIR